ARCRPTVSALLLYSGPTSRTSGCHAADIPVRLPAASLSAWYLQKQAMELDINLLRNSLRHGSSDELTTALEAHHPADLATALQDLEPSVAWDILHQAAIPRQAAAFGYLEPDFRTLLVDSISQQDLAAIVMHMRADDRADLYRQLTEEIGRA